MLTLLNYLIPENIRLAKIAILYELKIFGIS